MKFLLHMGEMKMFSLHDELGLSTKKLQGGI